MIWEYLQNIGFFALLFFTLVFVHELGHFLMARWCGVRVEKFSMGMGPALWSKKWGDTEYRIALLPLGGYVKMSGDDPSKTYDAEEAKLGFLTQTPPKKLLIVFGGPVFNLVLPLFIYAIMLMVGIPNVKSVIGVTEAGKPAALAGLQSGDQIVAVNGEPVQEWQKLEEKIRSAANQKLSLSVERLDLASGQTQKLNVEVVPELAKGRSRFGEEIDVGRMGVGPFFKVPQIYFEGKGLALEAAGVQKFDRVEKINGVAILSLEQMYQALEIHGASGSLKLDLSRGEKRESLQVQLSVSAGEGSVLDRLGVKPIELVVGEVSQEVVVKEGSRQKEAGPAYLAGVRQGDRLISIDGTALKTWEDVPHLVKAAAGREFEIVWSRDGEILKSSIRAKSTVLQDSMMGKDNPLTVQETPRIGVAPFLSAEAAYVVEQSWSPAVWFKKGVHETWELISLTGQALGKLVTGQLSLSTLGSPIMIFKVAGNSYRVAGGGQSGWVAFLKTLALLSISLGLVNLFPIPVLDGGHATFFVLEWIRGRPVSLKTMEIASQVGMVILLGLFVLVLYNDFVRYHFFDKIFQIFQ
jgi:regulator of sigma E protease